MRSKRVLAGIGVLGALGLIAFLAAVMEWWPLVALAFAGMIGMVGVIALNTNLLVRSHRKAFDKLGRVPARTAPAAVAATPAKGGGGSAADLTGTVRLLQAQYVARLDRAQSALERAASRLEAGMPGDVDSPYARLPHGSTVVLHHLDDATLTQAKAALDAGHTVAVVVADSADRERLEASGLADAVTQVSDARDVLHPVTVVLPGTDRTAGRA